MIIKNQYKTMKISIKKILTKCVRFCKLIIDKVETVMDSVKLNKNSILCYVAVFSFEESTKMF